MLAPRRASARPRVPSSWGIYKILYGIVGQPAWPHDVRAMAVPVIESSQRGTIARSMRALSSGDYLVALWQRPPSRFGEGDDGLPGLASKHAKGRAASDRSDAARAVVSVALRF